MHSVPTFKERQQRHTVIRVRLRLQNCRATSYVEYRRRVGLLSFREAGATRCRLSDLNCLPSSNEIVWAGVTDFLIGPPGFTLQPRQEQHHLTRPLSDATTLAIGSGHLASQACQVPRDTRRWKLTFSVFCTRQPHAQGGCSFIVAWRLPRTPKSGTATSNECRLTFR